MFIRSDRLFFRPCWPEDRADLLAIGGTSFAAASGGEPWSGAMLGGGEPEDRRSPRFLITVPGEGIVGMAALARIEDETELRVWIAQGRRGRGYGSEAVQALLPLARMLGHRKLRAVALPGNRAATRALARAGFVPTGKVGLRYCPEKARELSSPLFVRDLGDPYDCPDGDDGASRMAA
ncbi:hypothetical protein B2G71_09005 [Novosphingobium sp. PC22D]|uniref:GNAT family N-acetyltransferase n=1 Tax=Novosphingobium sp. PC22D TaxID=1962403 RepID=UPI000BFB07B6|nr:GNAT family N-acetyltransferase [Novosphingobium sp. PC22D]PEQ12964.1 hypothetical protein B2G71_09005 [Novosphingobium sp. PC22D]